MFWGVLDEVRKSVAGNERASVDSLARDATSTARTIALVLDYGIIATAALNEAVTQRVLSKYFLLVA